MGAELEFAVGSDGIDEVQFERFVAGVGDAGRDLQPPGVVRQRVGHLGRGAFVLGRTAKADLHGAVFPGEAGSGQLIPRAKRIVGAELIALQIANRQVDDRAADVADGHVGVASGNRFGDDGHQMIVSQHPVAVDAVDFLAMRHELIPVALGELDQFGRQSRDDSDPQNERQGQTNRDAWTQMESPHG